MLYIKTLPVLPHSYPENITPDSEVEPKTMTIGMNNVFEVGCGILFELPDQSNPVTQMISYCCNSFICLNYQLTVSQALKIGDNNVIESKGGTCASLFG